MSKRLISITCNEPFDFDYDKWMAEINSVLKREGSRLVNVTCADDTFDEATAWIEVDQSTPKFVSSFEPNGDIRTTESLINEVDDIVIKEVLKRLSLKD